MIGRYFVARGRVAPDAGIDVRETERAAELERPRRIVPLAADDDVAQFISRIERNILRLGVFELL